MAGASAAYGHALLVSGLAIFSPWYILITWLVAMAYIASWSVDLYIFKMWVLWSLEVTGQSLGP